MLQHDETKAYIQTRMQIRYQIKESESFETHKKHHKGLRLRLSPLCKSLAYKMIKYFLKDLPYTLTQPMFREFESKQKELRQWEIHSKSRRIKRHLKQKDIIEYIFAVGIYYRYVIAPLTRTGEFFHRVEDSDISGLLIGGREVGADLRQSMANAESHFHNVLEKYGLNEAFLILQM